MEQQIRFLYFQPSQLQYFEYIQQLLALYPPIGPIITNIQKNKKKTLNFYTSF